MDSLIDPCFQGLITAWLTRLTDTSGGRRGWPDTTVAHVDDGPEQQGITSLAREIVASSYQQPFSATYFNAAVSRHPGERQSFLWDQKRKTWRSSTHGQYSRPPQHPSLGTFANRPFGGGRSRRRAMIFSTAPRSNPRPARVYAGSKPPPIPATSRSAKSAPSGPLVQLDDGSGPYFRKLLPEPVRC